MLATLEQCAHLGLEARQVIGVHALTPEIGVVEIFTGRVAEQPRDILADEGRREIALGFETVDHRRGGIEQPGQSGRCGGLDLDHMTALLFLLLAVCVGQNTLDDIRNPAGIVAVPQHLSKRRGSDLGGFSRGRHLADCNLG
ncbi:MAG: hypothetical protein R6X03_02935 [Methyloceanibacter sp.]